MARRDALLRLHQTLVERRDELRNRLSGDHFLDLNARMGESLGDVADMAFETGSEEVNSQLAQLESRDGSPTRTKVLACSSEEPMAYARDA